MRRVETGLSFAEFLTTNEWGILVAVVIACVMSWAFAEAGSRG